MPLKVVSPPLAFVDAAIREPNAIYFRQKMHRKVPHMLMFSKGGQPSIRAQVSDCHNASLCRSRLLPQR
jgi:hypothetical protein